MKMANGEISIWACTWPADRADSTEVSPAIAVNSFVLVIKCSISTSKVFNYDFDLYIKRKGKWTKRLAFVFFNVQEVMLVFCVGEFTPPSNEWTPLPPYNPPGSWSPLESAGGEFTGHLARLFLSSLHDNY